MRKQFAAFASEKQNFTISECKMLSMSSPNSIEHVLVI